MTNRNIARTSLPPAPIDEAAELQELASGELEPVSGASHNPPPTFVVEIPFTSTSQLGSSHGASSNPPLTYVVPIPLTSQFGSSPGSRL